jgi:hypothetical protein
LRATVIPFARMLLVAALMISIGAQWAVLQSTAWLGMAVTYSMNEGSLVEGLSKTFDGDHPCPLCNLVEEGQKKEQKLPTKKADSKMELLLTIGVVVITPPVPTFLPRAAQETATARSTEPSVPPPRRDLA